MISLLRPKAAVRLGLAALVVAFELSAAVPPTTFAQAQDWGARMIDVKIYVPVEE